MKCRKSFCCCPKEFSLNTRSIDLAFNCKLSSKDLVAKTRLLKDCRSVENHHVVVVELGIVVGKDNDLCAKLMISN